jgi:tetratricopeptide (TPR) repeat protein
LAGVPFLLPVTIPISDQVALIIMEDAESLFAEGVALYGKGDFRRAIAAFDKALVLDPKLTEGWNNRGLAQIQTGDYSGALQSINHALALDPGHANAKKAKKVVQGLISESGGTLPPESSGPLAPDSAATRGQMRPFILIIAVAVIAVAGTIGVLAILHPGGAAAILPIATPTPVPTPIPVLTPTPTPLPTATPVPTPTPTRIPQTGVWVEVSYDQLFSGNVGTPGNLQQLAGSLQAHPNTGDQFYQIPRTNSGYITASVNKNDGSGDNLTVSIYSDGTLVQTASTTQPYGALDVVAIIPASTPALSSDNSTTNATTTA